MSRPSIATPCPAPYGHSSLPIPAANRRLSTTSFGGDDTAEIDYTRAFQLEFKNAKPRRKSTFQKKERNQAPVTIFEDVIEDEELVVEPKRDFGGSTLLGKRAQRIPGHAMRAKSDALLDPQPLRQIGQAERRSSIAPAPPSYENEPHESYAQVPQKRSQGGLKKEPRRRTIFVPTDDTSILTIHPGVHTTNRLDDTFQLPNLPTGVFSPPQDLKLTQAPEARTTAKKSRMSLSVAPKRLPLQSMPVSEGNALGSDVYGQNGGKENLPPKATVIVEDKKLADSIHRPARRVSLAQSKLFEPTAASQARQTVFSRNAVPLPARSGNTPPKTSAEHATTHNVHPRANLRPSPPSAVQANLRKPAASPSSSKQTNGISPHQRPRPTERRMEAKTARLQQYPVLSEDLAQPELYEDSWLGHQEVALAELINQIFREADNKARSQRPDQGDLRERMVDIYHQPFVTNLHKRLHASLLYGALSRPRDMSNLPNPAQDIGLRKRFLGMWLDSYSSESLRAAAEVVFGRQLPRPSSASDNRTGLNEAILDPHKNRRSLIRFLETFLIEVDDVEAPDEERGDDPNNRWRKMVLRSLMLIWLLDQAKTAELIQGCLFKPASHRKSSVAMLHSLVGMLIPSIGEITRILRHLDYEVDHVQDPLDEVRYRIDNIAVDLRDGILLTKLTEVLLFSPNRLRAAEMTDNATVTIKMPDLTILESALYNTDDAQCPRILSQHLKMPCLGRAQKTFNVEIAISALRDHGRLIDDDSCFTADDIVDGHREKTLSFLWSLVSNHGLDHLLDFQELRADIKRNGGAALERQTLADDSQYFSQMQQESLLKKWASIYAARGGLRIGNLTTSFADGKAYAAILDAFADYINIKPSSSSTTTTTTRLEGQLQAFGCSNAFIKQLSSTSGTIPSRKTTISNLAFLASRLLPLARQHNAAVTIQRMIRSRQSKIHVSQRITLMRLAHACATVVQTRNQVVFAATALQRAWRRVLDCRIKRLNSNVQSFQAAARSWLVRRRVQREKSGGNSGHSLRVMGGW